MRALLLLVLVFASVSLAACSTGGAPLTAEERDRAIDEHMERLSD